MAKRISELPAAATVVDTDELELNQSGTSRKATRAQIVAGLADAAHVHALADVTDAGALAAKDLVDEADIADLAVSTAKLADLSVSSVKIALESVSADQLADDAVTTAKLADGAVTTVKIGANAVDSGQLADGAATNPKIADGAVTTAKIAANAVDSAQLVDDAVTTAKIAADAVTAAEIAASAVGPNELAGSAVTTAKIANTAVTTAKIAANAVDSGKLANNAVISTKIAGNAVIAGKIAAEAVGTSQLVDSAVIMAKIANGAVNNAKLADGAVSNAKITDGAISGTKIAPKAVGSGQLADTTVTPGAYTVASVTVDPQGRITAASSGSAGEVNAGVNIGVEGFGVFASKSGVDLQFRHVAAASNRVLVTLDGDDIDIDVVESNLQIPASNVTGLGGLATKDTVEEGDIAANAVTTPKLADDAVSADKIAPDAVGPIQLADTAVTPGVYTVATITVDQQGRITAASSGTAAGETNTGSNIGAGGFGVFAGKVGADLQFRHVAAASNKIAVTLNGGDIDIDVVESNLQIPASNVTGLAPVATIGTLASLTSLDANGGALTNYLAAQDTVSGNYTFVQADSGREKVFTGATPATWTIPALSAGTHAVVHNIGAAAISFAASGVTLKGLTSLAADKTAAVSWLPGNAVKLTGELS